MKFDVVLTNPPFQDSINRKKTPHKLWIDFTMKVFRDYLSESGLYVQVSPASFSSPSNKVLRLLTSHKTVFLRFGTDHHFPNVGSSFSDYAIVKAQRSTTDNTVVHHESTSFHFELGEDVIYLPNDLNPVSMSIHKKVMFDAELTFPVKWDYVTCHNIRRYGEFPTLSETKSEFHHHPIFHTNRSVWWTSVKQPWSQKKKVMWTRSGYTKPFYDDGYFGGTDMVYYIEVDDQASGENIVGILNSKLFRYIFKTARWSGFGNEIIFSSLPFMDSSLSWSDDQIFDYFKLTSNEKNYVNEQF